jgi:hypothetical protein
MGIPPTRSPVKPPIYYSMKSLEKKRSLDHKIGIYIVNDMARFRQENYPNDVYTIRPKEIEDRVKTAIGDGRATRRKIIHAIKALTYGMSEDDFWHTGTRSGGRNYFIKVTPKNFLFLRFRLRLI